MEAQTGFASGVHNQSQEGVAHLRPMNVSRNGVIDLAEIKYVSATAGKHRLEPDDILFNNTNSDILVGKTALFSKEGEYAFSNHMTRLRFPKESVHPKFMAFRLHSFWIEGLFKSICNNHVSQASVSTKALADLEVALPSLDEQRLIVETLDDHLSRLDKALADLEVAAQRSGHLFLSALENAIEECSESTYQPLAECLNVVDQKKRVQRGWSPQCLSHPQSNSSNWAVLKTTAVQNMRYEPQHNKELPKTLEPKTHLEVQEGDFLMTTTGPRNRCGVVCLVTSTPKRLIFSGKILRFQPDSTKLLPTWLELVLASHKYQKQLDRLKVGSSDSSVSIGNAQVLELTVPVPSLDEQKTLVGKVEKLKTLAERFEGEIEQEAQKFKKLRRALLHAAVSGNLGSI